MALRKWSNAIKVAIFMFFLAIGMYLVTFDLVKKEKRKENRGWSKFWGGKWMFGLSSQVIWLSNCNHPRSEARRVRLQCLFCTCIKFCRKRWPWPAWLGRCSKLDTISSTPLVWYLEIGRSSCNEKVELVPVYICMVYNCCFFAVKAQ